MNIPGTVYNLIFSILTIGAYYLRISALKNLYLCQKNTRSDCFNQYMLYTNLIAILIITLPILLLNDWNHILIAIPVLLILNSQLVFLEIQFMKWFYK